MKAIFIGVPLAALLIAAERIFSLIREDPVLGTFVWVLIAVTTLWVTLSVGAIVDRKPGDWKLWILVGVVTVIAVTWLSGYNATTLMSLILSHK